MPKDDLDALSRRERQIMEILISQGSGSAADVREALSDEISDSAIRTFLRILVQKGHVVHRKEGRKFIYSPTTSPANAKRRAVRDVVARLFDGSLAGAVAAFVGDRDDTLTPEEIGRIEQLIEQAKQRQSSNTTPER